jgi:hypothetical protein
MGTGGGGGPDLSVALAALEADAARWSAAAADLRAAAAVAAGRLALDGAAFTFAGHAVAGAYEAVRHRTATLLGEGADNLDAVAAALRASAAAYAAAEAERVRRAAAATGPR